jgi:hypothetical protein
MAHGDFTFVNSYKAKMGAGAVQWSVDSFRVSLHAGALPNIDTAVAWSDVSATEASMSGYVSGGTTISTSAPTVDNALNRANYDSADPTWAALGPGTVTHMWLRKYDAIAAQSWLVGFWEITTNQPNGGAWSGGVHVDGVFVVT